MATTKGAKSIEDDITLLASRVRAAATNSAKDKDGLNHRQELFCTEIAKGNLKYQAARSAGYEGDEKVLSVTAAKLLGQYKIKKRIAELQQSSAEEVKLTREKHLAKLAELRDLAVGEGQLGAAIRAEELRGKISGLHHDEDQQQRAISERVAKLPVGEQLSLVQSALQRIQQITGTHVGVTIETRRDEDLRPVFDRPVGRPVIAIDVKRNEQDDLHEYDGISDEPVGIKTNRSAKDDDA